MSRSRSSCRCENGALQALLWQRAREPFKGRWSLPGGYLAEHDTLEESIRRHLAEKVDVRELSHLEQLETLSDPTRSPKEWQLATAYLGLVPSDVDPELPGDTDWHPVDDLPALAFDHESIVPAGRERLRAKLSYTNLGFALAPTEFTISELRDLYAAALGHDVSATNLQRVLLRREVLEPTGRQRASGPDRRPARLAFSLPDAGARDHGSVRRAAPAGTCTPSRLVVPAWTSNGAWLLVDWRSADQWVFIRSAAVSASSSAISATLSTPVPSTTRRSEAGAVRNRVLPSVRSRR